jgi:pimeloyl-ACP methyl ester carboxylesterase
MPRFTTADGCNIEYRIRGEGPLIALTPGGREPGDAITALADALAERATVLTWDRRNTGASDIFIGGESEQEIWAHDLADLVNHLGRGPAWIAGGSAGCRVSALSVVRRPEAARGLIVWSASGGAYGCQFLGFSYHVPYIMAAQRAGMEAVAETPFFAERIARNPANRERLLKLDPERFIETMKRWNESFYYRPEQALAGVPDEGLQALRLPTLIFEGGDDIHPASVSHALASLIPQSKLLPSPWSHHDWMDRFCGRVAGSVFDFYPLLVPSILEFIAAHTR